MNPAKLSVCCLTHHDPALVSRSLAHLRPFADEIVVAVDSKIDPDRLYPLDAVADTLVRFEFVDPPERARPWLVSLCHNDAVLMLDGDEVVSTALLQKLPELVADDSVVQCRLARRWSFPDEHHWLDERPWWPDYQRRLFRRGSHLDFDVRYHGGVRDALPARYVDEPIYHLACVLSAFDERRQRVRRYGVERPGLAAVGGGPMNDTLYVPEHFATLRLAETPARDVAMLDVVLRDHDPVGSPAPRGATTMVVSADEVARSLTPDPLQHQGYRAGLRVVEHDLRTEPGNDTYVVVEVANHGATPLCRRDAPGAQLRVATRLLDAATGTSPGGWALTSLPCDVPVGEARLVEALVQIPSTAGSFQLDVGLVNERGRWFGCSAHADLLVATRWGRYTP